MQKVLSLDISSKTGWAFAEVDRGNLNLIEYGRIEKTAVPKCDYPSNYVLWAYQIFGEILQLIDRFAPDVLVIEETSKGSKNAKSQKILEYVHFLVARLITDSKIPSYYLMTEEWRRIIGCNKMSDADKKHNKYVRDYKKKNKSKLAYDINGKRIGLIGRKHLNVRVVNEIFNGQLKEPLIMAQEDQADALGLLKAYQIKYLEEKNE